MPQKAVAGAAAIGDVDGDERPDPPDARKEFAQRWPCEWRVWLHDDFECCSKLSGEFHRPASSDFAGRLQLAPDQLGKDKRADAAFIAAIGDETGDNEFTSLFAFRFPPGVGFPGSVAAVAKF